MEMQDESITESAKSAAVAAQYRLFLVQLGNDQGRHRGTLNSNHVKASEQKSSAMRTLEACRRVVFVVEDGQERAGDKEKWKDTAGGAHSDDSDD